MRWLLGAGSGGDVSDAISARRSWGCVDEGDHAELAAWTLADGHRIQRGRFHAFLAGSVRQRRYEVDLATASRELGRAATRPGAGPAGELEMVSGMLAEYRGLLETRGIGLRLEDGALRDVGERGPRRDAEGRLKLKNFQRWIPDHDSQQQFARAVPRPGQSLQHGQGLATTCTT